MFLKMRFILIRIHHIVVEHVEEGNERTLIEDHFENLKLHIHFSA